MINLDNILNSIQDVINVKNDNKAVDTGDLLTRSDNIFIVIRPNEHIQIDNRLGSISTVAGSAVSFDYIDDDNIAYYTVTAEDGVITQNTVKTQAAGEVIAGPRGTILQFKIAASLSLNTSTYLFNKLGSTTTIESQNVRYIDSVVRVTGMKTGYTVVIPVRFAKTII